MVPRFRVGEVVRIARLEEGWADEDRWVAGQEGIVHHLSRANERGDGWVYSIWIDEQRPEGRVLWLFDEGELDSLGVGELESGERVPVETLPEPDELHDEVNLELITEITDRAEAERVAGSARAALLEIIGNRDLKIELDNRPWHEPPNEFRVRIKISAAGAGLDTFDGIVEGSAVNWESQEDDGWRCDFCWSEWTDTGGVFLVPEVVHAWMGVEPWDDPARRSGNDLRVPAQ